MLIAWLGWIVLDLTHLVGVKVCLRLHNSSHGRFPFFTVVKRVGIVALLAQLVYTPGRLFFDLIAPFGLADKVYQSLAYLGVKVLDDILLLRLREPGEKGVIHLGRLGLAASELVQSARLKRKLVAEDRFVGRGTALWHANLVSCLLHFRSKTS